MSFSVGTSSNVDMALDDMIKARRQNNRNASGGGGGNKTNAAARATGGNKAKRSANLAARRGLSSTNKANAMDVEKQVQRQAGRAGAAGQGGRRNAPTGRGGRGQQGGGGGRPGGPNLGDMKAKVRARGRALAGVSKKGQQQPKSSAATAVTAPSQQAIGAAAKAMKNAGFKPPKGMQMQISFVPKQQPQQEGGRGGGGGGRGGGRRRGGRGRGGGGRNN